jgi:uncharacterized protein YdeI (YjbR/CyaY-like superfamily)
MKGVLLKDSAGFLVQQKKNVQAQRQIRFVSLEQINSQAPVISAYIREAI